MSSILRRVRFINDIVSVVPNCSNFHLSERRLSNIILAYLYSSLRSLLFS